MPESETSGSQQNEPASLLQTRDDAKTQARKILPSQWTVVGIAVAFTGGAVVYKLLMHSGLGHSAAMFLGLPLILAVLLAISPRASTTTGGIAKGITLALLIVAPLVGEGYLCILIASPLFYIVGIIVGQVIEWQRRKRNATYNCILLLLLPMCFEGVFPQLGFDRSQAVTRQASVNASADAVESSLAQNLNLEQPLPMALRIGFPRPVAVSGKGLSIGDVRMIRFTGAEGDPPGDLSMQVVEHRPGYLRFKTTSDQTKLRQWVRWDSSEVQWQPIDAQHTLVTWRIHFERELDPAWYFAPIERAAVGQAAEFLIEANATPQGKHASH